MKLVLVTLSFTLEDKPKANILTAFLDTSGSTCACNHSSLLCLNSYLEDIILQHFLTWITFYAVGLPHAEDLHMQSLCSQLQPCEDSRLLMPLVTTILPVNSPVIRCQVS